jgi:predicted transcriptional regulator
MSYARKVLQRRVEEYGITIAELSRRTGIPKTRLKKGLKGEAAIKGGDFLLICRALQIETI